MLTDLSVRRQDQFDCLRAQVGVAKLLEVGEHLGGVSAKAGCAAIIS